MGLSGSGLDDDVAFLDQVRRLLPEHLTDTLRVVGLEVVHDRPSPRLRVDLEQVPRSERTTRAS